MRGLRTRRRRTIGEKDDVVVEHEAVAGGRLDANVGADPGHDQGPDAERLKNRLKARPNKRAETMLDDDRLGALWRNTAKVGAPGALAAMRPGYPAVTEQPGIGIGRRLMNALNEDQSRTESARSGEEALHARN